MMMSSHRLNSPLQVQRANLDKLQRKRILFLSLEGAVTEKKYFEFLKYKIQKERYDIIISIKVVERKKKDGKSSIWDVFSRLVDSKNREGNLDDDYFAVVLDRDKRSHSEECLREILHLCRQEGYEFYLTNPCFEFWLLMHVCSIKENYIDLDLFLENAKVSSKHTYTSKELSNIVLHSKNIPLGVFDNKYFPNIPKAVEQAKTFAKSPEDLFTSIGSNLYKLMEIIGISNKQETIVLEDSAPDC